MTYTQAGESQTCTWENVLVQVNDREVVMGPDVLTGDNNSDDCFLGTAFRMWTEEGDEDTLNLLWLDNPEADPNQYQRND